MIQKDTNYNFLNMEHFNNSDLVQDINESFFDIIVAGFVLIIIFTILLILGKAKLYILKRGTLKVLIFSSLIYIAFKLEVIHFLKNLYIHDYIFYLKTKNNNKVNIIHFLENASLDINVLNGGILSIEILSWIVLIFFIYNLGINFYLAEVDVLVQCKHMLIFFIFFYTTGIILHVNSPGLIIAYLSFLIILLINYGLKTWVNLKNENLTFLFKNLKTWYYFIIILNINHPTVSEILLNTELQHSSNNPLPYINLFYILICCFIIIYAYYAVELSKYSPYYFLFIIYSTFTVSFIFIYVNCLCCQFNQHPEPLNSQIYILIYITILLVIVQKFYLNDSVKKLLFILISMWLYTLISYLYLAGYIIVPAFKFILAIYFNVFVFFTLNYPYTKR